MKILVFLFDGYSDWETAYLSPEIFKSEKFELCYFSIDGKIVKSMGGLYVQPAFSLIDVASFDYEMLILPGGTAWEKGELAGIEDFTRTAFVKGKKIAAICAATAFLGQLGILDQIAHTSNDCGYLKACAPDYKGEEFYQNEWTVSEENIITANGVATIEFAREIFKILKLYDERQIEQWYQLYKNGIWNA